MCFSLFVIDSLVFSAHGIPIGSLEDRLGVNLTLLLTAMAFKWVLSDKLPDVPYLTTMEVYTLLTFMMLFLQGMLFWAFADLYAYRCSFKDDTMQSSGSQGYTDWFTGEQRIVTNNATNIFFNVSCKDIHVADRILLGVEVLLMVAKNIWFVVRVFHNRLKTLKKQKKFNNLGGLDDNQSLKEIQWIASDEIQGRRRSQSRRTKVTASPGDDENKEDYPDNRSVEIVQKI